MSLEAIVWSLKVEASITPSERLVLISLANFTNDDWVSWPKRSTLSILSHIRSPQTLHDSLVHLEEAKLITRIPWKNNSGAQVSNVYFLHVKSDTYDPKVIERTGKQIQTSPSTKFVGSSDSRTLVRGHIQNLDSPQNLDRGHIQNLDSHNNNSSSYRRTIPILNRDIKTEPSNFRTANFKRTRVTPSNGNTSDSGFDEFAAAYPKRLGSQRRRDAASCWTKLLKQGIDPDLLIERARWYNKFCETTHKAGSEHVLQMGTFLGPRAAEWQTDWKKQYESALANGNGNGNGKRRVGAALPKDIKFQEGRVWSNRKGGYV